MSRAKRAPGERPIYWVASSLDDLLAFPEAVKDKIGIALSVAQFGGKHPAAKPWKGSGGGVFEVAEDYRGDAYRAVYTVSLRTLFMYLTHFRRNRPAESRRAARTWN